MKPEETVDFHIRWAWNKISKMYNQEASKYDMTMSIGYALLNIDLKLGTPSTSLGPLMGMEPTSLSRTLKAMELDGLIVRESDKKDKRKVRVFLTNKGKKKREIARTTVLRFNQNIQDKIPASKLESFFEVMSQINQIAATDI